MPEGTHRYTFSELLRIAEEEKAKAKQAVDANEPDGCSRLEEWSNTLQALEIMEQRGVPNALKDDL
jgi:hypothetical protein